MAGWDWDDVDRRSEAVDVPSLPRYYVPRPRLHRMLDAALDDAKVTLLRAPAVSGKSTLLSGWHAAGGGPGMAYVPLDERDNDPLRFWSRVLGGLRIGTGTVSGRNVDVWSTTDARAVLAACMPQLLQRERSVLVLDRADELSNPEVCQVLGEFLLALPMSLRVILSARAVPGPALRTGLLRARGQMAEITANDLAFDRREMRAFFAHFSELRLDDHQIDELHERTEGWVGGVTLAGLALLRHPDSAAFVHHLSGSSRYVADLLAAEVFDPQPLEVREFMLATSVLDRMDGALVDTVTSGTGGAGGAAMLDRLERSGLFVEMTDEERSLFRYRRLFHEFLRHKLRLTDPEREIEAHRAAAAEYTTRGDVGSAITHYIGAGEPERAIRLVLEHGEETAAAGQVDELRSWIAALPYKAVASDVRLMLRLGGLCVQVGMRDEVALWLERARWRLEGSEDRELLARHALLVAFAHLSYGDLDDAVTEGRRVLSLTRDLDTPALRARAHHLLVAACSGLDRLDEARRHRTAAPPDATGELSSHAYNAWLSYREGRLDDAMSYADELLAMKRRPWQDSLPLVTRGAVRRERNQFSEAETDLVAGIETSRQWSRVSSEVAGAIELALLRFAQRREAEAFSLLTASRPRAHGTYLLQRVGLAEATLWLRVGDLERALYGREDLPGGVMTAELDARIALARGRPDEAAAHAGRLESGAQSVQDRIKVETLRARLDLATGDTPGAEGHLRAAIDLGRREQFVQVFAEDLVPLESVLRGLASGYDDPYPFSLLAAIAERDPIVPVRRRPSLEFEPLSDREQIVLRYLPTGLSNKRIAAELHMSVNTLKTHLKSIYRKLGTGSRDESVAHARELHLL